MKRHILPPWSNKELFVNGMSSDDIRVAGFLFQKSVTTLCEEVFLVDVEALSTTNNCMKCLKIAVKEVDDE